MGNDKNVKYYTLEASEFQWEIAEGKSVPAWGFNRQVPGPSLKAKKGDTLVVTVRNTLAEPTIIHWHGVRLPAGMDGTGLVQKAIEPGEEFEYRFEVPDAGTFWYHSHANETVQMERGMYGPLIVEDDTDPVFDNERVLMIDDMKLDEDLQFHEAGWFLPRFKERHDGREGNVALLNGKENPEITMHAGQMERWRIINASSARYFQLYLGGKSFKIIGSDGGLLEKPVDVTKVLITPGERVDIIAGPFVAGEKLLIESLPYDRRTFLKAKRITYARVNVLDSKPSVAYLPDTLRRIEPLAAPGAMVSRQVSLSVGPSLKTGLEFLVNGELHANDAPVRVGELQVWEVRNASLMDHPFHLHGFFFQVIEENGKPAPYMAWKDTYNLKPRTTIRIAWMPDNRPGKWMYHCHILEHHEAGMMAHFEVVGEDGTMDNIAMAHCHS